MKIGERDWGSLPPELLASVVQKVEDGAGARGEGRRLVALAGVCRAWRRSVHQQRQPPALLTFLAAVRDPAPWGSHLKCVLKKTGDTFRLVQRRVCGDEYFLFGARKKYMIGSSYFRISADPRILWTQGPDDDAVYVKSNFWRTGFTLQDHVYAKSSSETMLSVKYGEVAVNGHCQRKLRCELGPVRRNYVKGEVSWWPSWLTALLKWNHLLNVAKPVNCSYKSLKNCATSSRASSAPLISSDADKQLRSIRFENERVFSLKNKEPVWREQEQCWSLDFKGSASSIVASIHNFQLVSGDSSDGRVILQLGKLSKGLFILDFGAPLSPLEAFAISLSSFATSVGLDT